MKEFCHPDSESWIELGNGQRRKICAYNDHAMAVQVNFDDGAVGALHQHPHTQISYVLSGEFTYQVEGKKFEMRTGDSVVVDGGKMHGCTCVKAGTLLDIFSPMREDFIK